MIVSLNGYFLEHPRTGSGQYLLHLTRELRRLAPGDAFEVVPMTGAYKSLGRLGKVLWEQEGWPRQARRRQANVAHVPYFGPSLRCANQVVTIHDLIGMALPDYAPNPGMKLYNRLIGRAARRARLVLTDSHASASDIHRLLGISENRTRVIPLGVADDLRRPSPDAIDAVRRTYSLPREFALYFGGGDMRKNLQTIIKAWFLMKPAGRPPLVLAGRIPCLGTRLFPDYRKLATGLGLGDAVRLIGPIPEEVKPALLSAARVFLFPSRYEGFGLEPLEAMACGTPVVCSDATSLPEVVGDAALLAPPDEPQVWAEHARAILADPVASGRLAEAGIARAASLTWDRTARATLAAYGEIA